METTISGYVRLPAEGERCPLTGLKRGALRSLVIKSAGAVKFVNLRAPGAKRGAFLIHAQSLVDYLDRLAEQQIAGGVH